MAASAPAARELSLRLRPPLAAEGSDLRFQDGLGLRVSGSCYIVQDLYLRALFQMQRPLQLLLIGLARLSGAHLFIDHASSTVKTATSVGNGFTLAGACQLLFDGIRTSPTKNCIINFAESKHNPE